MSSKAEIANLALQLLGQLPSIVELDTDNNRAAAELKIAYYPALDAALADHPWKFALVRATWAASATAPAWGYANAFPFATNPWCLDVHMLSRKHHGDDPLWDVVGRAVHTDEAAPLYVEYISRVTDEALFHPMFVEYFAAKLAEKVAARVTGKPELGRDMREYRLGLGRDARWKSAVATGRKLAREGEFLSSRAIG